MEKKYRIYIILGFFAVTTLISCKVRNGPNAKDNAMKNSDAVEITTIENSEAGSPDNRNESASLTEEPQDSCEDDSRYKPTSLPEPSVRYIPFRHNNKYGLLDEQLNVKMDPTFDRIGVSDYSIGGTIRHLEDNKGHPLYRDEVILFDIHLGVLDRDTSYGMLSEKYCNISTMSETILLNVIDGTKIVLDGKISISSDNTEKEKYYAAQNCYLDKNFREKNFGVKMSQVFPFRDGKALVYGYDGVYEPWFTVINDKGEKIFGGIWDAGRYYSEGLLPVLLDGDREGFVDEFGELKIECRFEHDFSGGKISPRMQYMFKEGVCVAKIKESDDMYLWNIIDKDGNFTRLPEGYQPRAESVPIFHNGYLAVKTDNGEDAKYAFINKKAEKVFGTDFDYADNFVNGYAVAVLEGRDILISADGNIFDVEKDILK